MTDQEWPDNIAPHHRKLWEESGITAAHARARGIFSINADNRHWLADLNFTPAIRKADGLLIPLRKFDGEIGGYQFRPDNPRVDRKSGREIKYETPREQPNMLDFPPGVAERLADLSNPVLITEGVKKGDAGALVGLTVVDLPGTWNWIRDKAGLPDFAASLSRVAKRSCATTPTS